MTDRDSLLMRIDQLADLAITQCTQCGGTQRYRDDDGEWDCHCRDAFLARLADAEFPERFADLTLGDLNWDALAPTSAVTTLREYATNLPDYLDESLGLILSGPVGCGKTHLAIGIGKLACAYGYRVLFVNVPAWFQELRDAYASNSSREREWMDEMRNAEVLILDDLGAEKPSDWARERLYVVVNHRFHARRITFVTTNRTLEELELAVGERVMSRLYGDALAVSLSGTDYRRVERERRLSALRTKRVSSQTNQR